MSSIFFYLQYKDTMLQEGLEVFHILNQLCFWRKYLIGLNPVLARFANTLPQTEKVF